LGIVFDTGTAPEGGFSIRCMIKWAHSLIIAKIGWEMLKTYRESQLSTEEDQAIIFDEDNHDSARLAKSHTFPTSFWSERRARHAENYLSFEKGRPCQNMDVPIGTAPYIGRTQSSRAPAVAAILPPKQWEAEI